MKQPDNIEKGNRMDLIGYRFSIVAENFWYGKTIWRHWNINHLKSVPR